MEREAARRQLLEIYASALRAVAGDELVRKQLRTEPINTSCCVIAVGKAAEAMALGAQQALGPRLLRGLLVTKHGYLGRSLDSRWYCIEAGHPLPDADSLHAGQRLLDFLRDTPADSHLLFLISGGASALVEVLAEDVTPELQQQINRWLLASGLDIDAMNRVRKGLSAIKAGRLAAHLRGRAVTQLLLSDVPGDDYRVIGSGLLVPHSLSDLATSHLQLPAWILDVLNLTPPLPESEHFSTITTHLLASNHTARLAAQYEARQRGLSVVLHDSDFQGDAELLGNEFARTMLTGPSALHIWGGEATVKLPPHPGRGGRCQQLALCAALHLRDSEALLLAAGTDGSDGPGDDAGALVDGGTVARGEVEGLSAQRALQQADSGTFLEASGDLLQTGPTGSNVMDLVLGLTPG
ncbi:MAG TPA: DUF4147 domain-containing protein [Gammaproteobacteria bacterium]